jgi:hypothetical protein
VASEVYYVWRAAAAGMFERTQFSLAFLLAFLARIFALCANDCFVPAQIAQALIDKT